MRPTAPYVPGTEWLYEPSARWTIASHPHQRMLGPSEYQPHRFPVPISRHLEGDAIPIGLLPQGVLLVQRLTAYLKPQLIHGVVEQLPDMETVSHRFRAREGLVGYVLHRRRQAGRDLPHPYANGPGYCLKHHVYYKVTLRAGYYRGQRAMAAMAVLVGEYRIDPVTAESRLVQAHVRTDAVDAHIIPFSEQCAPPVVEPAQFVLV